MAPSLTINLKCFEDLSYVIISRIEYLFNRIGKAIAKNPWRTIILCWSFVLLTTLGLLRFHHEKNPVKLWTPPNSDFAKDTEWLTNTFKRGYRPQISMIRAIDVLQPGILRQMNAINSRVWEAQTDEGVTWTDLCFRVPIVDIGLASFMNIKSNKNESDFDPSVHMDPSLYCTMVDYFERGCLQSSILEIWKFSDKKLKNVTKQEIIDKISTTKISPVTGHPTDFEKLLGGVTRNETGHIIAAETVLSLWMLDLNFSAVDMDKVGNTLGTADWATEETIEWENEFLKVMEHAEKTVKGIKLFYTAGRSFADISGKTMLQDIPILMIGIFLMVTYVQMALSKYNCVEARFSLGALGLLSIGMAFVVSVGLCSLFGVFYGPVHTSFPFLLMGLGVDDMFVMMSCWKQYNSVNKQGQKLAPLHERMGAMLRHAGVSITVTSLTDFVVFIIGSTTVLPSLRSFCIYAAVGILINYIFVVTFFTACFTLDQIRVENNRNALIPCIVHKTYERNKFSDRQYVRDMLNFFYSKIILTIPGKISVIILTIVFFGIGLNGTLQLKEKFDPMWFIPENTYLSQYVQQRTHYYPGRGFEAGIYTGQLNYTSEYNNFNNLLEDLENATDILQVTSSWIKPFNNYMTSHFNKDLLNLTLSEDEWNMYLAKFLFSPKGSKYQANFQFEQDLKCGVPASKILASNIEIQFKRFSGPEEYLPAMHRTYQVARDANFSTGDKIATAWGKVFGNWCTDEIIENELSRNLALALVCVMLCTVALIVNIQMCVWILTCVILTMISVCGFMQIWGLTIDLVSCIALTLAIGLCFDYAAHIGYSFLATAAPTREERILQTVLNIGAAVLNGGISTLLALFMLSFSQAYTFQAFFKIFLLVILFGQFYGVIFLPVVLSLVGPKSFKLHTQIEQNE